MEHIRSFQKRYGVDVGFIGSETNPSSKEGCVGKSGIDKNYTLSQIIDLASRMTPRPNIIIKGGANAKWYLKHFPIHELEKEIEKQKWRGSVSRCTMYIIEWE